MRIGHRHRPRGSALEKEPLRGEPTKELLTLAPRVAECQPVRAHGEWRKRGGHVRRVRLGKHALIVQCDRLGLRVHGAALTKGAEQPRAA